MSTTVRVMVQRLVLPAASVAWKITLLLPTEMELPLTGPLMRTAVPLVGAQLSVKVGVT